MKKILAVLFVVSILLITVAPISAQETGPTVESVTAQLEAIDSLQEMQDKRDQYTTSGSYNKKTTSQAVIDRHVATRTEYETYLDNMFAARLSAQIAYDSLTPEQQAQIDPELVAKLDNELPTTLLEGPFAVTPRDDEYIFEAVKGNTVGFGYEVSNYMVAQTIPQTFILVDTSDQKTSWSPDGIYEHGKSNYEVLYCCDYTQGLVWGSDYRRINLEDSDFFNDDAAKYIRAIVQNSYPYVSIDEMKENLKNEGLDAEFVDSLNRSDIISAVQMAIWHYSYDGIIQEQEAYYSTISVSKNSGVRWFTALHDFTNEMWEWLPSKGQQTFDAETEYKVNNLLWYLCNLDPVEAEDKTVAISEIKVGRTDIVPYTDDTYEVTLHVMLNEGCKEGDDVTLKIRSYSTDENGTVKITDTVAIKPDEKSEYGFSVYAKEGDTIEVTVEGTQDLGKGVYFYESEGGARYSQSLVGVSEGETPVKASLAFTFDETIEKGIRIYKKSTVDQSPISDITFDIYKVEPAEGEELSELPTESEVAKYAVEENLVGSVVTDITGFAELPVENDGTYLIIERHNTEKVEKPVDPFYITIPWPVEKEIEGENGIETVIEYEYIVSVYPKNTPITPPPPPPPPPPEHVEGRFSIIKHDSRDESMLLSGAEFQVYRPATEDDTDVEMLMCGDLRCAVVPLLIDGEPVVLITDENGAATSPYLDAGTYYVKETKAPLEYVLRPDIVAVSVVSEAIQELAYVRVENTHGAPLPETGGIGTVPYIVTGTVLMLGCAFLFLVRRSKYSAPESDK